MCVYAENESAMKKNEVVLLNLPGESYTIKANIKFTDCCKHSLAAIQAVQNQKEANTGSLAKLLKLKTRTKVMLTVNLDIQDRLINDKTVSISCIEFVQGIIWKVYIKFLDEKSALKVMRSSYLSRQSYRITTENCEDEILIKKRSPSPSIKPTQFLLTLVWASISHSVQEKQV